MNMTNSIDDPVIGVLDYHAGNAPSVARALNYLGLSNRLLKTPDELAGIDRIVLPGVGSAGTTMGYLSDKGWPAALRSCVVDGDMPFLGICVGLQLVFESSEEQDATCFGWLPGRVRRFDPALVRIPHMGWNSVRRVSDHPFMTGIPDDGYFYFVNSYYAEPGSPVHVAAASEYGLKFASVIATGNIMGTQFHIEKSGPLGLSLLRRFASLSRRELC
jgi:imidazole glycerol-phosphate synthase subunit HisH